MAKIGYFKNRGTGDEYVKDSLGNTYLKVSYYRREVCTAEYEDTFKVGQYTFIVDATSRVITEKCTGCKVELHDHKKFSNFSLFVLATFNSLRMMPYKQITDAVVKHRSIHCDMELLASIATTIK